jgi:benzoate-CoA ligase
MNAALAVLDPALALGLGDHPALIGAQETLSYRQLRAGAFRWANALRGLGIQPGQRVLLLLRDSPALVCAYLGALAAGGVAVPLNPRSSDAEVAFVLRDSGCALALVAPEFASLWRRVTHGAPPCPAFTVGGCAEGIPNWEERLGSASPHPEPVLLAETDMAFWIYTSGTTGEMKACVHRQQDVLPADAYLRETLGVGPGTRLFATSKLFFAYALGTCLFGSLRLGATTLLLEDWPTPDNVAAVIARHQPHVVFSVPAFYRRLLGNGGQGAGAAQRPEMRDVRTWVSAGERLPAAVFERWRAATGAEIVEGMGTSETLYMILSHRPGQARPGSCGRPAPGVEARLLGVDGRPVGANAPGILQVRMASASSAYWNRPERSAAAFGEGWFTTGDVFTVDREGFWRHGGRQADRLATPDGSLNPADIEEALQAMPGVADACLVPAPGETAAGLSVFAVSQPGAGQPQLAALTAAIQEAVARLLPPPFPRAAVRWLPELPRTAAGKVQRYRLRRP